MTTDCEINAWVGTLALLVFGKFESKKIEMKNRREKRGRKNYENFSLFGCPCKSLRERKLNCWGTYFSQTFLTFFKWEGSFFFLHFPPFFPQPFFSFVLFMVSKHRKINFLSIYFFFLNTFQKLNKTLWK